MSGVKNRRARLVPTLAAAAATAIVTLAALPPPTAAPAAAAVNESAHLLRTPHPTVTERRAPEVRLRRLFRHGIVASLSADRFSASGGYFYLHVSGLLAESRCRLSSGRGVRLGGTYPCGVGTFAHRGRALPNRAPVTRRWSVYLAVERAGRVQHFGWVVSVRPAARPATATAPVLTLPPAPATTTTIPPTTTTSIPPTTTTTIPPTTTTTTQPVVITSPPSTSAALPGNRSSNWAGYYLPSANGVTKDVSASWIVPTLDCATTPNGDVAEWIGVDGASSADLFQTGTETTCSGGVQSNEAWVEELPATASMLRTVATGDEVSAHIFEASAGEWQFTLTDVTQNWQETYSQPVSYTGPESSADWIVEDPTDGTSNTLLPFGDFGSFSFSGLSVNGASPALSLAANGIEMAQQGALLALPDAPGGGGFTVNYE